MQTPFLRALALPIAALLGLALFCLTFGAAILDPREFGWMIHGDSAQHYLGWAFFRSSEWQWPLGLIDNFGYPFSTTITFTDSIPLVALPLKLISGLLPVDFNYFGWWMAGCSMLNAVFAAAILSRQGLPTLPALTGAAFFAIAPCLMLRAYGHESLLAHWLILASYLLYLRPDPDGGWRLGWSLLLASALLVHPYLFVMNAAVYLASLIRLVRFERSLKINQAILWALWNAALALLVMFAAGYFHGDDKSLAAVGYPNYSANLLTWFDPMNWRQFLLDYQRETAGKAEWSRILPPLGQAHRDQYEGFAYLGAGMLALLLVAVGASLLAIFTRDDRQQAGSYNPNPRRSELARDSNQASSHNPNPRRSELARDPNQASPHNPSPRRSELARDSNRQQAGSYNSNSNQAGAYKIPLLVAVALLALYSFSTKLTFGSRVLFDIPLTSPAHEFLSIYRACGRFIWPATYLLMLWAVIQTWRHLPQRAATLLLLAALGLQLYDLSDKQREFRELLGSPQSYQLPLTDPVWQQAMQQASHLIVLDETTQNDDWIAFSVLAARHGVPSTAALIARVDERRRAAWIKARQDEVLQGRPQPGSVYVSRRASPAPSGWRQAQANGWWVLYR